DNARETVDSETPARRATSAILLVAFFFRILAYDVPLSDEASATISGGRISVMRRVPLRVDASVSAILMVCLSGQRQRSRRAVVLRVLDAMLPCPQLDVEARECLVFAPAQIEGVVRGLRQRKRAAEGGMRIPEADQFQKSLHHWAPQGFIDLRARVITSIDVAADMRTREEFHVIGASEQSHIVDLRHAG